MSATVTTLKPAEPAALVDLDIIAKAAEQVEARADALAKAEASHEMEQAELEIALEAYELAVAGQGGDPLEAALKVEEQSRRERVAAKVLASAADQHRRAVEDHRLAGALALKPVHKGWRQKRLEASRAGDAADAAKAKAMADYAEATAALRELAERGLPDLFGALDSPITFRTELEERALWELRGIDDAHPDHPWHPGEAV